MSLLLIYDCFICSTCIYFLQPHKLTNGSKSNTQKFVLVLNLNFQILFFTKKKSKFFEEVTASGPTVGPTHVSLGNLGM